MQNSKWVSLMKKVAAVVITQAKDIALRVEFIRISNLEIAEENSR